VTVAVLGPGAVGGALAVRLALADVRVVCVARPETAAAIEREGLTLDLCGSELQARPEATARLEEAVDLLLVTVKAPALQAAMDLVAQSHKVRTVVPLMNGIEHVDALRARFGDRVAPGSIGRFEAYRESPTRIVQTTAAPIVTIAGDEEAAALVRRAGIDTEVVLDEKAVLWAKLTRLAPLSAATAITQLPVGELRTNPDWRFVLETAITEACAVATADGIEINPAAEWEIIEEMPPDLTTSTARDVAAGRPSELDAIAGAVVRAGRRLEVPIPTLQGLWEEACRAQSH
jgi:2-dehydropantoate 2-reductase